MCMYIFPNHHINNILLGRSYVINVMKEGGESVIINSLICNSAVPALLSGQQQRASENVTGYVNLRIIASTKSWYGNFTCEFTEDYAAMHVWVTEAPYFL